MKLWGLPVALAVVFAAAPSPARADGWRCGSRLVDVGDLAIEVRGTCGEPAVIERRTHTETIRRAKKVAATTVTTIEEWSYRVDGSELLRTLVFNDGRLMAIRVGEKAPVDKGRCERQTFMRNTSSAEVKLVCGEPASLDRWLELEEGRVGDGVRVEQTVTRERWVYNFGPSRFLRIFELTNGRLVEQRTGGYGF